MLMRPLRLRLLSLATGLCLGISISAAPLAWVPSAMAQAQEGVESRTALSVKQARAAANRILRAVQSRDANLRYSQFSDELKAASSPSMVSTTMQTQPKLLSWKLLSVQSGLRSTTVEASLITSKGKQELFMLLNGAGQLTGYYFDLADEDPSQVAKKFVTALSQGHFISARSFLSLRLQMEIGVASLQERWQLLQRQTGAFVAIRKVIEADSSADEKLVLVNMEFNRLSDSLYVILNANNEITGIDFPSDQITPKPVR